MIIMMIIIIIIIIIIILFFIIYVPSQQPKGQLQTQHRIETGNYIIDKRNIKTKTNYRPALVEEKEIIIIIFINSVKMFSLYSLMKLSPS
jgi:hypothetical protein